MYLFTSVQGKTKSKTVDSDDDSDEEVSSIEGRATLFPGSLMPTPPPPAPSGGQGERERDPGNEVEGRVSVVFNLNIITYITL